MVDPEVARTLNPDDPNTAGWKLMGWLPSDYSTEDQARIGVNPDFEGSETSEAKQHEVEEAPNA